MVTSINCDNSGEGSDGDAAPDKGGFYSNTLSKIHHARAEVLVVAVVVDVRSGRWVEKERANFCATKLFGHSSCHHAQNHAPKDAHDTNKWNLPVFTNQPKHDHLCRNPKE